MKRKYFIQKSLTAGALLAASSFPYQALAKSGLRKVTILHTNDQHSRIEAFPMDGGKYQGLGGFAQRATLISQIRKQEKNVLLLDSGDIWQGTPYFNKFHGEIEFKLMSEMNYQASTLGNHDFDIGIDGFVKQLPLANFPFLNCNYDFTDTAMQGKVAPYKIFKYDGIKIGVLGVGIELEGLVPKDLYGNIKYNNPIEKAENVAKKMKLEHDCDLVICLSHLGYKYDEKKVCDIDLATQSSHIDLILGGHTHTFFDKPVELANAAGARVLINQVGWAGIFLGRLDFYFEEKKKGILVADVPHLISEKLITE
ncbi:MAG: metallophosphatase [Chitinophagales bacterium]|nr:metallophosphatase [Chitinophagales bacterium]